MKPINVPVVEADPSDLYLMTPAEQRLDDRIAFWASVVAISVFIAALVLA